MPLDDVLGKLSSLVAVVDVRGTFVETNRPVPARSILSLVSEGHRDEVRALLLSGGFSTQPTRVRVTDRGGHHGWLELAPAGDGNLALIWLSATPISAKATPAPAERMVGPTPSRGAPGPLEGRAAPSAPAYAIVADPEHREVVASLRRALDTISPSVAAWFAPEMSGTLGGLDNTARVIVLGDSRYTRFLRKLAGEPAWALRGMCWAREGRRAAIWYQPTHGTPVSDLAAHEADLESLMSELKNPRAGRRVEQDEGHRLAQHFIASCDLENAQRRSSGWPNRLRYTLGVGRFLLDGFTGLRDFGTPRRPWHP